MNENAPQLGIKISVKRVGIFSDTIYTYVNITLQNIVFLTVVKRNDVRIIIMIQILFVDFKQIFVRTKNVINVARDFFFVLNGRN